MTRVGVVGHTEWVDFAVCARLPEPGEILEAREGFSVAGGGGAVAAVQLSRLGGDAFFVTAVGDDEAGARAAADLVRPGLELHAATRAGTPQRRAITFLTDDHERTITVLGERMVPEGTDALPWDLCARADAIYLTGGDVAAVRHARAARVLVATPRVGTALGAAGVQLDAVVASANDAAERTAAEALDPPPRHLVLTDGGAGGRWSGSDGTTGAWSSAPLPGPAVDAYGCGDSFAAGLTFGLGEGRDLPGALELAAACGAHCLTGRGPYGAQLALRPSSAAAARGPGAPR